MRGQTYQIPQSFPEVSRVNRIALVENVWHLMMSGIYGVNYSECFAKLEPHGLWQRMYQDYYQVKMDGSLEEFLGTWPKWGVIRGGIAFQPTLSVQDFGVSVLPLWQRPIASDCLAWVKIRASNPRESVVKIWKRHGQDRSIYDFVWHGLSATQAADFQETMMGFPPHWTDLTASETP